MFLGSIPYLIWSLASLTRLILGNNCLYGYVLEIDLLRNIIIRYLLRRDNTLNNWIVDKYGKLKFTGQ